ncbi:MAG: hypothetical protein JW794_03200 [Candidatus Cloacimonetes bacterium]|nr:hypothetical protein [Candidatus Cloacimonadota bacterium]
MKTSKAQYAGMMENLRANDFKTCLTQIEEAKEKHYKEKEKVLFYLDAGMLYHYCGDYRKSNEYLEKAEFAIEDLYTKSIGKAAASVLLNDNALDYFGEDYEDIYLNIFKALNYLHLNDPEDAFVEIRRINNKLNLLEDKYKKIADEYNKSDDKKRDFKIGDIKFYNSALARYLSMLLYYTEGKYDDARIDLKEIREAIENQPTVYNFEVPPLESHIAKSDSIPIYFLSFVGNSPDKKSNTLWVHTEKDMLIIATSKEVSENSKNPDIKDEAGKLAKETGEFVSSVGNIFKKTDTEEKSSSSSSSSSSKKSSVSIPHKETETEVETKNDSQYEGTLDIIEWEDMEAGYHFKFDLPYMDLIGTDIAKIAVLINDQMAVELIPLESMEQVAFITYKIKEPLIYLKTITRTVVKGILAESAKQEMVKQTGDNLFGKLAMIATDVGVDATENADLRISRFFPAKAFVGHFLLPEGIYNIRINYYNSDNKLVYSDLRNKQHITKNGLQLFESFYLD